MQNISPDIICTEDGSATLIHPVYRDTYHSTRGAVGESEHLFIDNGLKKINKKNIKILEIGFGSGLNALVTLKYLNDNGLNAEYHTVEKYPVSVETIHKTGYANIFPEYSEAFMELHRSAWNNTIKVTENFSVVKHHKSFPDIELDAIFDIIYFDAFSPDTQPEMWTQEIFINLFNHTAINGLLSTYSSKGIVKQNLRAAGYTVKRLKGALGKRHMLNAIKESDGK